MKHYIPPQRVGLLLTLLLLGALASAALAATDTPRAYLPIVTSGHAATGASPTATHAAGLTPTSPGSATATSSASPTGLPLPTDTPAPTGTSTATDVPTTTTTVTATPTRASTEAPTTTATPTSAPTDAPSATATVTSTPTDAPTDTATPTATDMPTSTVTPTAMPSATSTPTIPAGEAVLSGSVALEPVSIVSSRHQSYVVILDTSTSMSLNVWGQAVVNGVVRQCGLGPDPALNALRERDAADCTGSPAWSIVAERRITIAKAAIKTLVSKLGPNDRVALVTFDPLLLAGVMPAPRFSFMTDTDKAALFNSLDTLTYVQITGTPAASALNRARTLIRAASATAPDMRAYQNNVVMLIDGVANYYTNHTGNGSYTSNPSIPVGWENRAQDQPGCGTPVAESEACQIGYASTTTNSQLPRPLTAMALEGGELQRYAQLFVVALVGVSETGLDHVASVASAPWLSRSPDGAALTSIMEAIQAKVLDCPNRHEDRVSQISPPHLPDPQPGLDAETFGVVQLVGANGVQRSAPIRHDPLTGLLTYRFEHLPAGSYTLSAAIFYKGEDGVTRRYERIVDPGVTISAPDEQQRADLVLVYSDCVCVFE